MIEKVENFVKRLRCGKLFISVRKKRTLKTNHRIFLCFKSPATPLQSKHLNSFEDTLYDMIQSIEFTTVRNEFLSKLQKDMENICSSKNMLLFGKNSTNLYKVS